MNPHIRIASSLAVLAGVFALAAPTSSGASTLLSGYGGPGAGEQAILGSTLLHERAHGAGAGGLPSGGSSRTEERSGTGAGAIDGRREGGSGRSAGHSPNGAHGGSAATGRSEGNVGGRLSGGLYPSSERTRSTTPLLGLSVADVIAVLAVAGGLALLGALTLRLARLQR